jgi:hypothetical protein
VSTSFTLTQINLAAGGAPWGSAVVTSNTKIDGDIVRAAVSYKF